MNNQEITVQELKDWQDTTLVTFAKQSSAGISKELKSTLFGDYKVFINGKLSYLSDDAQRAVDYYNHVII